MASGEWRIVTLRQLLNLEAIDSVPKNGRATTTTISDRRLRRGNRPPDPLFQMPKQTFAALYQKLPTNEWGAADALPRGCKS